MFVNELKKVYKIFLFGEFVSRLDIIKIGKVRK